MYYQQDHSIYFLDKNIIDELKELYPNNFKKTSAYRNDEGLSGSKSDLISLIALYFNYLIYEKGYIFNSMNNNILQIHTNGYSEDESETKLEELKKKLNDFKNYDILNAQGDGISDEYPKAEKVHKIFYDFIEETYPTKSKYEI